MKNLFVALVVLVALLSGPSAFAAETVAAGQPFSVAADHDGIETTSYKLYVNGVAVDTKDVTQLQSGVITFARPAAQAGTYVFYIEAIGPGGAQASSTLTVTVQPPTPGKPGAPRNLRVIGTPGGSSGQ